MSRDEIEEQVIRLVDEGRVATLCIHGDEPGAVATAALVRRVLNRHGIASAHSETVRADGPGRRESRHVHDRARHGPPGLCRVGSFGRRCV